MLEGIITKNFLVIQEEQPGLDLLLGEVTKQAEQVRDFSLLFALIQFKILLVNAITINIVFNINKV
jgi:hypothetical protein